MAVQKVTGEFSIEGHPGYVIDSFYDRYTRSWIAQIKDVTTGYTIGAGAEYSGTRAAAAAAISYLRNRAAEIIAEEQASAVFTA